MVVVATAAAVVVVPVVCAIAFSTCSSKSSSSSSSSKSSSSSSSSSSSVIYSFSSLLLIGLRAGCRYRTPILIHTAVHITNVILCVSMSSGLFFLINHLNDRTMIILKRPGAKSLEQHVSFLFIGPSLPSAVWLRAARWIIGSSSNRIKDRARAATNINTIIFSINKLAKYYMTCLFSIFFWICWLYGWNPYTKINFKRIMIEC